MDIGTFFKYFLIYVCGFTLGSYGGLFSESAGIINIALEGSMALGAFMGMIFLQGMNVWCAGTFLVTTMGGLIICYLLASLVAIIIGALFSFLLSFVAIRFKADQTVVGTALNTLVIAATTLINISVTGKDSTEVITNLYSQYLQINTGVSFIDNMLSGLNFSLLLGVLGIAGLWILMNKTRFGLRLRACGENPAAADSVGINVSKMRYIGTAIGSASAAFAGFLIFSSLPVGTWKINALGYGFLVLAIEIFGNWKATNIIFCSIFFGLFFAFAPTFTAAISVNPGWGLNRTLFGTRAFYYMLPYLIALISLVIFSKKSRAPKAEGIPYDKSSR